MYKNLPKNYPPYEVRQINSFRELLELTSAQYADKAAFKFKAKNAGANGQNEIKSVTYSEFKSVVDAFGTSLCDIGVNDKHIILIGENSYDWARAFVTILNTDGVVVPVDKDLSDEETQHIFNFSDSTVVMYTKALEQKIMRVSETCPNIKTFICLNDDPEIKDDCHFNAEKLISAGFELIANGDVRFFNLILDKTILKELIFTSGTTGKSKGVMLTASNILFNAYEGLKLLMTTESCLSILPYHHSYESTCGLIVMLYNGITICINDSLRNVLPNFKLFKPTEVLLVPLFVEKIYRGIWDKAEETKKASMLKKMIKMSNAMLKVGIDLRAKLFSSVISVFGGELKIIICGGAPIKPYLVEFFDSIGIPLINGYGISECGPLVSLNRPCYHPIGSVGLPLPNTEILIDNPNSDGEGEICVRGGNVMLGYYKNQEATNKAIVDGWFHTGDIGKIDGELLYITGRIKNLIILQNGKNVYPEEIEEKLCSICEYIDEVVVYEAKKNEEAELSVLGAEIYPAYERAKTRGVDNVEALIRESISKYNSLEPSFKTIKNITFRTEAFPKNTSNKILRNYNK